MNKNNATNWVRHQYIKKTPHGFTFEKKTGVVYRFVVQGLPESPETTLEKNREKPRTISKGQKENRSQSLGAPIFPCTWMSQEDSKWLVSGL